ncbi:diacylglycerol kinase family protein [Paraflavitalea sp. CAU 1676]|uniref:diacylglycerol kinase family protein n=1 Tax=Paraflavitalea sp. CAU 1676 TaxID=3032598 RepID=UPI0023DA984A|nr:diacylglycerol kinase family protein [Paraflavitalea sp. CAU 1676]MDF2193142.1 diacylglycerol kinase family protein [Paraflavitalea sp. CAU 1676]
MKPAPFSTKERVRSFRFAGQGILSFLRNDHNAWIHLGSTVAVIVLAGYTGVTKVELLALVFVIGLVWLAEMFNTCIERIMDFISTERKPEIKFIKDVAAGAVLVAAIAAFITGCIVFIPKFIH